MKITSISSRDLNQDVSKAKKAAMAGPVFITDRGKAAHVLLSIDEYQKITNNKKSITELLASEEAAEIEFTAPQLKNGFTRPADFS